jgi:outer membrane lipoprotein SlyB
MRTSALFALIPGLILLSGCVSTPSARTYSRNQMMRSYDVDYGQVVDVRVVKVEGNSGIIGTWGGATVGRAVGRASADGRNRRNIAAAVGGVAGAVAGRAIERKIKEDEALEITVTLDGSADTIAVVQGDDVALSPGDRVRVLRSRDGSARVTPL